MTRRGTSRPPRRPARAGAALGTWALIGLVLVAIAGCNKARTPEEALRRFREAVNAGDPAALFDALDQRSRWAWMTVQKSHREAYDIILSNYPEGHERERELHRFERGATLGSARALFAEELGRPALAGLRALAAPDTNARIELAPEGESATALLASGARVPLRHGENGTWGFAGFAAESEERQNRALQDVNLVRVNAADYERAATRNAR